MIPVDVIGLVGDRCDPYTALHVLSLNKVIYTELANKRAHAKQRCRFFAARESLKEHVRELRDRVYGFGVNGVQVIEYTISKDIMVNHQKIITDSTQTHDCITVLPVGYGIVKTPHDNYIAFVSFKTGTQINSFGHEDISRRPCNYLRPCLSPRMADSIKECMCTNLVQRRKLPRSCCII